MIFMEAILSTIPIFVITALVQTLKQVGLPPKHAKTATFLIAMVLAIVFSVNRDIAQTLVVILQYSLAAIGAWELVKPVVKD